jgi:pimeloyl-ACP methyl ester carboxylesterase
MKPRSHVWKVNGLSHHVLEWGESRAESGGASAGATVLVVHGFQDAAATWDDVAVELAQAGLRVLAPDMRGFGDGPRVPAGAYYYFPDYVSDLAGIVRQHVRDLPLFVVGHSMGATIVTYFAGAFPERVTKLALIDGVGPPDNPADVAPIRMRRWIGMAYEGTVPDRKPMTFADALSRLQRFNPDLDEATLARKVPQLTRRAIEPSESDANRTTDAFAWKYDPLHLTTSPLPFYGQTYKAFARQVTCPVLHVSGGTKGHHVEDEEERLACFPALSRVTIEGGHALHWTKPRELAAALLAFWGA